MDEWWSPDSGNRCGGGAWPDSFSARTVSGVERGRVAQQVSASSVEVGGSDHKPDVSGTEGGPWRKPPAVCGPTGSRR